LGPGYDILGLALDLRCRVEASPATQWRVTTDGVEASAETVALLSRLDIAPQTVSIASAVPQAAGLGSSAALLVATAAASMDELDHEAVFALAADAEGHPDNVAAAVFGGLVATRSDGGVERLALHSSLHAVIAVPSERLSTEAARAVVPSEVPREVAVRTATRIALLIEGLRTGQRATLAGALGDEIHEGPRQALTDTPARLISAALQAGASYACWSGAGPSVLAFCSDDERDSVAGAFAEILAGAGDVIAPSVDRQGVRIE
jgi:homoserine kinase